MNNIFEFATGELSQDAFICWFFNWFNEGDNTIFKELVCKFCRDKIGISNLHSVDIHRQFSRKVKKDKSTFSVKIDVLVILNGKIALIIEDKTFTSEHSNQILRYEEGLRIIQDNNEGELVINNKSYHISDIKSVYWKTGFFYNYDTRVKSDIIINADYLIDFFNDYRKDSQIIDMYVQKLLDDKQWYKTHEKYWDSIDGDQNCGVWNTNLCNHQIAQYTMMREFFPEEETWKEKGDFFFVEHGTSYGRPWTEIWIYYNQSDSDSDENKRFRIFWRIDTDSKGSYISLRLHKSQKGDWDSKYEIFKEEVKKFIESDTTYLWKDINPGKTSSYKEADIAHFTINKDTWEADNGHQLIKIVRALTEDILELATTKYGPNVYEAN